MAAAKLVWTQFLRKLARRGVKATGISLRPGSADCASDCIHSHSRFQGEISGPQSFSLLLISYEGAPLVF